MADFTEEILKRKIDTDAQLVSVLAGIKTALEGSGNGGGNVTLGPLQVLIYEVTAETENGLTLQTFTGSNSGGYRTNKTAEEIRNALNSGRGIMVGRVMESIEENVKITLMKYTTEVSVGTYEGKLLMKTRIDGSSYVLRENEVTGFMETAS